jgi:hypothetical protein
MDRKLGRLDATSGDVVAAVLPSRRPVWGDGAGELCNDFNTRPPNPADLPRNHSHGALGSFGLKRPQLNQIRYPPRPRIGWACELRPVRFEAGFVFPA